MKSTVDVTLNDIGIALGQFVGSITEGLFVGAGTKIGSKSFEIKPAF